MAFLNDAKGIAPKLPVGSIERLIMDFLLQHGVGRQNAQPWSAIEDYLRQHGHSVRQQAFQQGLLKQSREGTVFIGSSDHGVRGYFLIRDKDDAEIIRQWYERRIAVEQGHLTQLKRLMQEEFPA
jgi:hypothetical protein